jgi:hypothetical protein
MEMCTLIYLLRSINIWFIIHVKESFFPNWSFIEEMNIQVGSVGSHRNTILEPMLLGIFVNRNKSVHRDG